MTLAEKVNAFADVAYNRNSGEKDQVTKKFIKRVTKEITNHAKRGGYRFNIFVPRKCDYMKVLYKFANEGFSIDHYSADTSLIQISWYTPIDRSKEPFRLKVGK